MVLGEEGGRRERGGTDGLVGEHFFLGGDSFLDDCLKEGMEG